jgi:KipI family sensor histidine kinase inhibitor
VRLIDYGEHAILAELDDPRLVPALRAALAAEPGVLDAVAGASTVLAVFADGARAAVRAAFGREVTATAQEENAAVTLPVVYDGADLDDVAAEVGMSADAVADLHSSADYVVRFCGFSPGFAYLDGLPEQLRVPRRAEPRTAVPAGAVGVAGEFTGVYPRRSPGGWRLLGRTDVTLWDATKRSPALLAPGTRVRFERR